MIIAQFMLIWIVVCFVVGTAAYARGRRFWVWFLWAFIISPLVAGLLVALLPDLYLREQLEERRRQAEFDKAVVENP
jgi:uncharacterized protein (DUF58 family)